MAAKKPPRVLSDVWQGTDVDGSIHIVPRIGTDLFAGDEIYVKDSLTNGPCDIDPVQQLLKRKAYWRTVETLTEPKRSGSRKRRRKPGILSVWRPVGWTTGSGSSRKYGEADDVCPALARFPDNKPVVIWTARHWTDRLALWWSLDSIHDKQLDVSRFTVATAQSQFASDDPTKGDPFSIACVPAANLRTAFDRRVPLTVQFLESGASLWHKYADPSPLAIDEARRNGCAEFSDLPAAAEAFGFLYPRRNSTGNSIRLSLLDEAFLEGFQVDDWLTPWEVLWVSQRAQAVLNERADRKSEDPESGTSTGPSSWDTILARHGSNEKLLRRLVDERVAAHKQDAITPISDEFGSMAFTFRLYEWAMHHPGDPLLESHPGSTNTNPFTGVRYRLTSRTRRILDEGILAPDDAPPMFAGGCEVYRREPFWVRCESDDDWWLERR